MMTSNKFTNMLGEFFVSQKTPEFKPCSASMQELDKVIKKEKENYIQKSHVSHPRYMSADNIYHDVSFNSEEAVIVRDMKNKRKERPSSLVEKFKQRLSPSRNSERIVSESDCVMLETKADSNSSAFVKNLVMFAKEIVYFADKRIQKQKLLSLVDNSSLVDHHLKYAFLDCNRIANPTIYEPVIVPDERAMIESVLIEKSKVSDVIITTGGTGCGKRDVTPEATINVVDRRCTGLEVALHSHSLRITPMAALSRAVAGLRGSTLIVNFPGSVKAVKVFR
ncbi:molybdopterin binding domain protein [Dictyocaulus viviparus]|uniref:molybdopterin molybdotransferase n=1 Tax=Dictyocaulus viviparus TaxID=29172 RepID=A0A0D8Y5T7_DICVI|nr:molybdopterin binding domain protein [Dictyocaulus viviparus]